jgi:hypothetical protein
MHRPQVRDRTPASKPPMWHESGMKFVFFLWLRTVDGWPQTLCRGHRLLAAARMSIEARARQ